MDYTSPDGNPLTLNFVGKFQEFVDNNFYGVPAGSQFVVATISGVLAGYNTVQTYVIDHGSANGAQAVVAYTFT